MLRLCHGLGFYTAKCSFHLIQIVKSVLLTTRPINAVRSYVLGCDQSIHTPFRCTVEVTTKDTRHILIWVLKQGIRKAIYYFMVFYVVFTFKKKQKIKYKIKIRG